jgi:wyosine [tRNA(Phe)-imidazoG37] synthetase (radical SAM superfamily)
MSYFYGPVPSRRLGFSLGVDIIPRKVCSFDCIYCQVGVTTKKSIRRFSYIDFSKFEQELRGIIKKNLRIDYITFSGSGEPTLHKDLGKIIGIIKRVTKNKYPICIITNSSLLYRKDVRAELKKADLIIPSLDAADAKTFKKINRPHRVVTFKKVLDGLAALRKEFKGEIWLEIMFIAGINDSLEQARKFKPIIDKIGPDKIQINLPVRPAPVKLSLPSAKRIAAIKAIIDSNIEVASSFHKKEQRKFLKNIDEEILKFLRRRPANALDLSQSLGIPLKEANKCLKGLLKNKKIEICRGGPLCPPDKKHFIAND